MADPLVGTAKEIPKSLSAVAVDLSKAVTVPLLTTFQIPFGATDDYLKKMRTVLWLQHTS